MAIQIVYVQGRWIYKTKQNEMNRENLKKWHKEEKKRIAENMKPREEPRLQNWDEGSDCSCEEEENELAQLNKKRARPSDASEGSDGSQKGGKGKQKKNNQGRKSEKKSIDGTWDIFDKFSKEERLRREALGKLKGQEGYNENNLTWWKAMVQEYKRRSTLIGAAEINDTSAAEPVKKITMDERDRDENINSCMNGISIPDNIIF
jgi:hypothetical protein